MALSKKLLEYHTDMMTIEDPDRMFAIGNYSIDNQHAMITHVFDKC